jgi:hypothetical protein
MANNMALDIISKFDWAHGALPVPLPAHAGALLAGGAEFLTRAFHATETLAKNNRITAITCAKPWNIGGTGAKLMLSVTYEDTACGLPNDLFVKFSRNFDDVIRDSVKHHLKAEVRLANLSRAPEFPIAVPLCLYADYDSDTGTGIMITEQIAFGQAGIEPPYAKCLDHKMPTPLAHYQAIFRSLALLSGSHKAGRLGDRGEHAFPLDMAELLAADRNPYTAQRLRNRALRLRDFAVSYQHLLPANIADPAFTAQFIEDAPRFLIHEDAIRGFLYRQANFIALCHWNANIDNAWFWRDAAGKLQCGLMDWGRAGQMHIAMTLWGSFSGADPDFLDAHLDELLALFATGYEAAGGPRLDLAELTLHVELYAMMMGLAYLLDAPPRILAEIPDLAAVQNRFDPIFERFETPRVQLTMMCNVLNLWQRRDLGRHLRGETFVPR